MKYPKLRNSRPVQGNIDVEEKRDVYLNQKPPSEPARCPVCGNIYAKKRWYRSDQIELDDEKKTVSYTCPGCNKVQDGYYYGELTVTGRFIVDHHEEISHLIQNEVHRAQEDNPLSKLVQVNVDGDELSLRTTNSKLAERIGRKLEQAYAGELEIDKSEYITRVDWHRDDIPQES
jgi:NMD protein affecting ribosome stability and mRNA decay